MCYDYHITKCVNKMKFSGESGRTYIGAVWEAPALLILFSSAKINRFRSFLELLAYAHAVEEMYMRNISDHMIILRVSPDFPGINY